MYDAKFEIEKIQRKLSIITPKKACQIEKICQELFRIVSPNLNPESCNQSEEEWLKRWINESNGTE